jgi:hypothetical protein
MSNFVNFNDESLPIGKRKQAYIRWAVSKGTDLQDAKKQANKKFGFEQKPGILAIVTDYGRANQKSFTGSVEVFAGIDLRKYQTCDWVIDDTQNADQVKGKLQKAKEQGWEILKVSISA